MPNRVERSDLAGTQSIDVRSLMPEKDQNGDMARFIDVTYEFLINHNVEFVNGALEVRVDVKYLIGDILDANQERVDLTLDPISLLITRGEGGVGIATLNRDDLFNLIGDQLEKNLQRHSEEAELIQTD